MKMNDKRWPQISKMMLNKKNKVMLLEVPKGFKVDESEYGDLLADLAAELKKAGTVKRSTTKRLVKDQMCMTTATSKENSSHLGQILMLTPNADLNESDANGNLQVSERAIDGHIKLGFCPAQADNESSAKHIIRQKPKKETKK